MQASVACLLFCTSAYWVLMEALSTTTNVYINQILDLLNKTNIPKVGNVSLPTTHDQKCCQQNLKIFMEATKTTFKEKRELCDDIHYNLAKIHNCCLPECASEVSACGETTVPFTQYKDDLENFLSDLWGKVL